MPILVTGLLVFCAVFYFVVSSGHCGAEAESQAIAASAPAGADAGPRGAASDATVRDDWAAGLGLIGGPRPNRAPDSASAPELARDASGSVGATSEVGPRHGPAAPAPEPQRFALSAFARSQAKERGPPPPPSTVLCEIPPNAILVLELTASVSTHLGFFDTYRAYRHPCGHSLDLYLERTDRIVVNAMSLGDTPACMPDLTQTAIEIEDLYALWIFPYGGVITPCSSPHALSTRSRDQRTPRQGSSSSRTAPAPSTPAADGSRSPTTSGAWSDVFGSAPPSTPRGTP